MRTAVIGGGAAGFFLAINLKEMCPKMDVTIIEKGSRVLRKVEVSGGGRCNCTNSFEGVNDLKEVYPRGHRLMKRLFNIFDYRNAYQWFEHHGVALTTQADHCVFPKSQTSHSIINCFLNESRKHNIHIEVNQTANLSQIRKDYDFVAVATGGNQSIQSYQWLIDEGIDIEHPKPSLYSLAIEDDHLKKLMGRTINLAKLHLPGTKIKSEGTLLITHWGLSGPAALLLSSHAALLLHSQNYKSLLSVNWTGLGLQEVENALHESISSNRERQISNYCPFDMPSGVWHYLIEKSIKSDTKLRWKELNEKNVNRLTNTLTNDTLKIIGRAPHRDEFVTFGGVKLSNINSNTLESKLHKDLYFAGEVLDIDGVTGGFNFQAAWTTAYVAAKSMAEKA